MKKSPARRSSRSRSPHVVRPSDGPKRKPPLLTKTSSFKLSKARSNAAGNSSNNTSSTSLKLEGSQYFPLVIDNGSGSIKAGLAGEDAPRTIFANVVGSPASAEVKAKHKLRETYVGSEAQLQRGLLNLRYPMADGLITNWADMEIVWAYCFDHELRLPVSEHPVLLTEAPGTKDKLHKEKMLSVMFEKFNVPGMNIVNPALLALYATDGDTGVVLDVGDTVTSVVPFNGAEGAVLSAIQRGAVSGRDVTKHLQSMLGKDVSQEMAREVKEKLCYTAHDYQHELKHATDNLAKVEKRLGSVRISKERISAPEALFEPSLMGKSAAPGVADLVANAIKACPASFKAKLLDHVVLSGSSTLFDGFPERLHHELSVRFPDVETIRIVAPEDRGMSVWFGGAVLSGMEAFAPNWVTKKEFLEHGRTIIHTKRI